jgi:ribose 5-phosphate isomerase B
MKNIGIKDHKPQIYIGSDHAGFVMKEHIIPFLKKKGYEVFDCGAFKYDDSDDYPDFIAPVAKAVSLNPENIRGIIFGGSGQGEAITANRFPNVRAVVFYGTAGVWKSEKAMIQLGRRHNDSNIISLGARMINLSEAKFAIEVWLETNFSNIERHIRRIKKLEKVSKEAICQHF